MERYFIGDACIGWSFGDTITNDLSERVLSVYQTLKRETDTAALGIRDIVPSYNAIAVHFDPATAPVTKLIEAIDRMVDAAACRETVSAETSRRITIPVCYTGEDLGRVAKLNHLTVETVIRLHSAAVYRVAMVGFLPHFPYLIGLDDRLVTPPGWTIPEPMYRPVRWPSGVPRRGVYPRQSPGGWNIVGFTDPRTPDAD